MSEDNNNINEQPNVNKTTTMVEVETAPVTSVGTWLLTFVVLCIPIVGIIMTVVWMLSAKDKSRANYFKAMLIMYAVVIVMFLVLSCAMGGVSTMTM